MNARTRTGTHNARRNSRELDFDEVPADFVPRNPRKRGSALLAATIVITVIFAGRLVDLQAVRGEQLADAALNQRLRTQEVPAYRGSILDRTGQSLAVTIQTYDVTADQTLVEDPAEAAVALGPILEAPQDVLAERLTGTKRFIYLAKGITPAMWDEISELRLPGIYANESSLRKYPADRLASHVVGYVTAEGVGGTGIESSFDAVLRGTPGEQTFESGPGGKEIPTKNRAAIDALPGSDVQLTIDRDIQYVAQEVVGDLVVSSQASGVTAIVMDVRTGEVLAMANAPDFDPNRVSQSTADEQRNRAVTDIFEPGSTGKAVTAAAVINERAGEPLTVFKVPGTLERADKSFSDYWDHETLRLTLTGVFAKSSNIGMILAAEELTKTEMSSYLERFGFGRSTEIGLPGESDGLVLPPEKWFGTVPSTTAFGQGYSVTALQMTSAFATIANGGVRVEPTIVSGTVDAEGTFHSAPSPERDRIMRKGTARKVMAMMEAVVGPGGTAQKASISNYRVAGKTGTAQFVDIECGCYAGDVTASFIGVAPADAPVLAVSVFVHQPQNGRSGGELAAPAFRTIMSHALQALHVPPSRSAAPQLTLSVD